MAYIGRDIQYGVLDKQSFTTNGSTTAFVLDSGVKDAKSLLVSVGGVIQEPEVAYTASGTTLTFTAAPANGLVAYAIFLGKTLESTETRDQITFQSETGDATTTPFTLSATPANAQSIMVTLNGVTQVPNTDYTVSGTTITFTVAPANGMGILVYHLGSAAAIGTINDNSVTDAKIVGMSASKLSGSLGANTVASTSIVSLDASKLTGSLPNSLAVDTTALDQTIAALGLHVAVADNKVSFNLPDAFLDQFEGDDGILTETDTDRNTTGEYVSSITDVSTPMDTALNIAPSSSDWDYTFDGSADWTIAGNTLGDHTIGGFVKTVVHADSSIYSLHTFSGPFVITFTLTAKAFLCFGVYAIDEDATRTFPSDRGSMQSMTNSFWWHDDYNSVGTQASKGSSAEGSFTSPANGSVIVIRRITDGTITLEDDGVVIHTYSSTYTGDMRLCFSASGGTTPDIDNLLYEDTSKVQRDGFFNEGSGSGFNIGNASGGAHGGVTIPMTSTGNVTSVKTLIDSVGTAFNAHMEVWSSDGTSPDVQIGTDSVSQNLSSTGEKTFTFSTPVPVVKGVYYWFIVVDEDLGSGSAEFNIFADPPTGWLSGRNNTITSITDFGSQTFQFEVVTTRTGEPTADHDTLLLIHSNTSDGSTDFVDSSQNARTVTANGDVQHDTAQKKFGATAMLFDGTGDYVTVPDSNDWDFSQYTSGTVDFWIRTSTSSVGVLNQATSDPINNFDIYVNGAGKIQVLAGANGSAGAFSLLSTTVITDSAWHHCAVVWSNGIGQLFVDGTSEVQNTYTNYVGAAASKNFEIGRGKSTGTGYTFNGWLDEVRVSRVARWDADFTPPTAAYLDTTFTTITTGTSATGTLISTASTASSANTSASGVMLYSDASGTATLGTDLKVYFTADDGANWTEAASYGTPITFSGTTKMVKLGKTTGLTSGTQMKLKAEWANQASGTKETRLHGWALNY